MFDAAEVPPARSLPAGVPPVYEDLFPIGAVPSEPCPIHNRSADPDALSMPSTSTTPTVDSIIGASSAVGTSGTAPTTDIILERVLGPDGVMRIIMRQKR